MTRAESTGLSKRLSAHGAGATTWTVRTSRARGQMDGDGSQLSLLIAAAATGELAAEQQQELLTALVGADAAVVGQALVRSAEGTSTGEPLMELVENNQLVALQVLIALGSTAADHLPRLLAAPATCNSVRLVNRLTESVEVPSGFLTQFASHAIETCEALFVNYEEDKELARAVASLATDLITHGLISTSDLGTTAQGFAIDYVELEEASALLRVLEETAASSHAPSQQPEHEMSASDHPMQGKTSDCQDLLPLEKNGVVVLLKGGRLASWHALVSKWEADGGNPFAHPASVEHVELMLTVAARHALRSIEGFRLLAPQSHGWSHWWAIEFPDVDGAAAWMEAEMRPPYGETPRRCNKSEQQLQTGQILTHVSACRDGENVGAHGYFEYSLAWRVAPRFFASWANAPAPPPDPPIDVGWSGDPREVPVLPADQSTVVVVAFERKLVDETDAQSQYLRLVGSDPTLLELRAASERLELIRLEVYQLIAPGADWHRVWVAELPSMVFAERWITALTSSRRSMSHTHSIHLARKHAPEYFRAWVPTKEGARL